MKHTRRATLLGLSLALAAGCRNTVELGHLDESHEVAFVAQDAELARTLTEEGGWQLSPVLADGEPFNRAGLRFDASGPVEVEGRASLDGGGTFGPWQPVQVTFVEGIAHNAHLDTPGATHVQLRFLAAVESRLGFLAVELFDYEPPGADELSLEAPAETEQGLVAANGQVVRRPAWGGRASRCIARHTPSRITVHHTVTPNHDSLSVPARMRQIQSYHMVNLGWCDVGYHFLIGQDGRIYEGRPENRIGAHAAGANTNNAGVSFIGTFTSVAPSQAMMSAGARALRALADTYGIPLDRNRVKGHRQVGSTATDCPGNALYNRLEALIASARGATGTAPPQNSGFCSPSKTGTWCVGAAAVRCQDGAEVSSQTCEHGCQSTPQGTSDLCAPPPTSSPSPGQQGTFSDVPTTHWAYEAIETLAAAGVLEGCGQGRFCPEEEISRSQMAALLSTLDGVSFSPPSQATFSDVPTTHWGFAAIEEQASRGVFLGCVGDRFCPNDSISRAHVAVLLGRARDLPWLSSSTPAFSDVGHSHWAYGAIEAVHQRGFVRGCRDNRYCPADLLTRAQAAALLVESFGL